jgi:hypothetical protein
MWRLPLLNFLFVLVLITFLALQHSASVFAPAETRYEPISYDPYHGRFHAESDQAWTGIHLVGGLGTALGHLNDLWQRSMIMKEWLLEYQTTYWKRIDAARGAESDLVEARFHVANAEVFGAAMGEQQRAKIEFARADRYLQKALPVVGVSTLLALEAIRNELTAAEMDLKMTDPKTQTGDERIKADLDRVINSLHGKQL